MSCLYSLRKLSRSANFFPWIGIGQHLSNLPSEMILDIADQLDDAGMNALACTNRRMYDLLNKRLYHRDVAEPSRSRYRSLIWVARNDRMEATVRWVVDALDASRPLNPIPESFHIALLEAADRGCIRLVEALLKFDGINPNFGYISSQGPPLVAAIRNGHSEVVELLLGVTNIDPNVRDPQAITPLYHACKTGDVSIVRQLLARDDVNPNTIEGSYEYGAMTPLLLAISSRNTEIVELLLAKDNIDVNFWTPLYHACRMGDVSIVRQLLARDDVNPNTIERSYEAMTPLLVAISSRNTEIVELLLAKDGIDVNLCSRYSRISPLMMAVKCGWVAVVESLLARDELDPNIVNSDGDHVLPYSVFLGRDFVKLLLSRPNVDLNAANKATGHTALMKACGIIAEDPGNAGMVEFLLDQGVEVNQKDTFGRTALWHAILNGQSKIIKVLLDREDTDLNVPDRSGRTPLAWATAHVNLSLVKLLVEKECVDVNARGYDGRTPLALACILVNSDSAEIVSLLRAAGARE
ncbi:Ankyrin repeat-containing domain protein [Elaphomyces granulatus]